MIFLSFAGITVMFRFYCVTLILFSSHLIIRKFTFFRFADRVFHKDGIPHFKTSKAFRLILIEPRRFDTSQINTVIAFKTVMNP